MLNKIYLLNSLSLLLFLSNCKPESECRRDNYQDYIYSIEKTDQLIENQADEGCDLSQASFKQADLREAYLRLAVLTNTNFHKALLDGVNMSQVKAGWADFSSASLIGVNLKGAFLRKVNFQKANLTNADLRGSSLKDADFRGAILSNVLFQKADFGGANLKNTDLSSANFEEAYYRKNTVFPENFNPKSAGMIFLED